MADNSYDLIVIGAGPGGYVAAIRASQLGMKVACVEKEPALGGTCLRVGCIPSKALLESSERYWEASRGLAAHGVKTSGVELDLPTMLGRKDAVVTKLTGGVDLLFRKNKIARHLGHGKIDGPGRVIVTNGDAATELRAPRVLIATGSASSSLPGVEIDGERVVTSTEALSFSEVPGRLVVIGAGYIGLELGSVWNRLGSKVMVLEFLDRILPGMDAEIALEAKKTFERQGIEFHVGTRVIGARAEGAGVIIERVGGEPILADRALVSVGRAPNTAGLGLETVGIKLDARGRIEVDGRYRTSAEGFFAIGDVIPGPMLAHKAEEEGVAAVELMAGRAGHVNYACVPGVCYTHPEIATVGRNEEELKAAGVEYVKGVFLFRANGRALGMGDADGRVKVLADAKTDRVLGVHIIGPRAGDIIAEATVAMEFGASAEDLARAFHAHPTLAEALKEAAMATAGRAIHM